MFQYRCEQCRTTSPSVLTRSSLDEQRQKHRHLAHGGHIPDGERVLAPEKFNAFDVPLQQWIVGGLMALTFTLLILFRTL
ncbi:MULTISPECIES: hypothetical protein [unclassified Streptomyces]|uniref:hypothetical protein n=1 Tax=unclassified Streptomyces TaxID=2593676 RepID=UPI002024CD14|nr:MULTISPECIES: hypothetical protein [unclassified Streptomyces]MCX4550558.1 hypothetical protein [Streptomyces sp. NBC_01500]WSC22005.1 hypothetical protein OIE60_21255 [Streptomyces sp. NBC_01766]